MSMKFKDQKPIYLQIAEHLCDEILQHRFVENERLPSVREYAAEMEVNVNTMVRSYDWLSQHDFIYNRRGLGYFVSEGAEECIKEFRRQNFYEEELPEFLKTMQKLNIPIEELLKEMQKLNVNMDKVVEEGRNLLAGLFAFLPILLV